MILNKDTNTVYFSDKLFNDNRFKATSIQLTEILRKHGIGYKTVLGTNDIWCRDYMPIQVKEDTFVQFRYEPSYLKEELEIQSNPKSICRINNIDAEFSNINLDGGNVVNWSDRVIITDRVFDENPEYSSKTKLISEIEKLLEVEVIIIPQIKSDMTGHADGMVRFVNRNTLVGNDRVREYKYWSKGINKILKEHNLNYIDIPFLEYDDNKHPYHAIGCYINYLEIQDLIVLPVFEVKDNRDEEVINKFVNIFPDRTIETINYNAIGLFGGLLNCTTWTIKE